MRIETLLHRLEVEQNKLAHEAMRQPAQGDFNYGKFVGIYAGLDMAKRLLLESVADAPDFDN